MPKSKGRVLVIDDALEMANALVEYLRRHGFEADAADSGDAGIARFKTVPIDAVLTDLRMKGTDGMDVLRAVRETDPDVPVVIMTAFGAVESAVEAIQRGANHYVTKPFKLDVVRVLLERAIADRSVRAENLALRRAVRDAIPGGSLVGRSAAILAVRELTRRVAGTNTPVLVLGETGAGKELVARDIHAESPRRDAAFVAVNCAALPEALLESELFGHVRGSFTGATQNRRGLFVEANNGTLFLDEIGEMPLALQAKLLRVLETGQVRSVGSDAAQKTDVRIIAATHRDLVSDIRAGRFRQDLYFRLNVVPIRIPPLRDRADDIPLLLEHFLRKSVVRFPHATSMTFTPDALALLVRYAWPGNVRQLENAVDRWLITSDRHEIGASDVRTLVAEWDRPDHPAVPTEMMPLHDVEEKYIAWVLDRVGGNKTRAAEILEIDPSTLYRRGRQRRS